MRPTWPMQMYYFQVNLLVCLQFASFNLSAQVYVKDVTVNDKAFSYQVNQPVKLQALDNEVTITFATGPAPVSHYRYRLMEFESQWNNSPYPIARYTNLPGGKYVLIVQSVVNGQINANTRVAIWVEQELMEEWWFIPSVIVYVLVLIGAAMYFFMLYDFRQKLKVQSIRYRLAADLHDEVGATLSSIAMATNMVQRKIGSDQTDVHSLLTHIKADSEETIHTIRDTVWTINPDNDSPQMLFEKMRSLAFGMLTPQDIALEFNNQIPINKSLKINMEQRRNLYLIFKEAINNIAKHSQASKASVYITRSAEGFHLLVEDNGVGFDTHKQSEGNGLKNFHLRAKESFIDLTIDSAIGKGTRLILVVPEL